MGWKIPGKRVLLAALIAAGAATATASIASRQTIKLRSPDDIANASNLKGAVDGLFAAARSCPVSDRHAILCVCNASELRAFDVVYNKGLVVHPEWYQANTAIAFLNPTDGDWTVLDLATLRGQVTICQRH